MCVWNHFLQLENGECYTVKKKKWHLSKMPTVDGRIHVSSKYKCAVCST